MSDNYKVLEILLHHSCNQLKMLKDGGWPCLVDPFVEGEDGNNIPNWNSCIKFFQHFRDYSNGMTKEELNKWNKGY